MASSRNGPDQCWSWVIAMAGFIINMLLSGISRAAGIFFVALINDFGASRREANIPFTIRNVVRNMAGPVVGMIGQRYGVQEVTIIGGICATLGISLCCLAPSVLWITVLWGGLHGLGVALANTLFQITVNQYFDKYRATAAGLALSGACIGSFVLPIILEAILGEYGLAGTYLLTGGLVMQVLPPSVILKEPPWLKNKQQHNNEKPKATAGTPEFTQEKEISLPISSGKQWSSADHIQILQIRQRSWSDNIMYPESSLYLRTEDMAQLKAICEKTDSFSNTQLNQEVTTISTGKLDTPTLQIEVPQTKSNPSMWKCLLRVYKNPMFHLISLSLAVYGISFDPLTTVIVDYAKDKGHDDYIGKYFISILALGDLVGRMCFGWVTDKKFLSLPQFMIVSYVLQGIAFALLPLFSSFEGLMCLLVFYGVAAGTGLIMFPVLVAQYLESEQSLAFGCIAFFAGVISFVVPPLIGHFRDGIGSYDGMFFIIGGVCVATGLLWLLEPLLVKLTTSEKKTDFK